HHAAHLPPVSILFAAFLGYNPIQHLLGPHALATLSAHSQATITGRSFFPHLISGPFRSGLKEAFLFAIVACLVAAAASLLRGGRSRQGVAVLPVPSERPRRITERAAREGVTQPAITLLVNRLENRDLVLRTPDPLDRRAVLVDLTPAGHELLEQLRAEYRALL